MVVEDASRVQVPPIIEAKAKGMRIWLGESRLFRHSPSTAGRKTAVVVVLCRNAAMQAVAGISLGRQWRDADFPVLVIYGLASPVTTAHQNRYLVDLINRMHPGRATYREVPEMSHDLHRWASPEEYMMNRSGANSSHPFQEDLFAVMMPWLEKLV